MASSNIWTIDFRNIDSQAERELTVQTDAPGSIQNAHSVFSTLKFRISSTYFYIICFLSHILCNKTTL